MNEEEIPVIVKEKPQLMHIEDKELIEAIKKKMFLFAKFLKLEENIIF